MTCGPGVGTASVTDLGVLALCPDRRDGRRGVVPEGATCCDGEIPAVTNLDPDLLSAPDCDYCCGRDTEFLADSGWRSLEYQLIARLMDAAPVAAAKPHADE